MSESDTDMNVSKMPQRGSQTIDSSIKSWFKNGDFKLHILNEKNILITTEFIEKTLKKYGLRHKVKNLELFQTAMIHVSYMNRTNIIEKTARLLKDIPPIDDPKKALPLQDTSYGRLEYLGDAVIHHAIADYLYDRYSGEDEGFLTKLRTKLEKAEALSELSKKLGFHKYAIIARNVEIAGGRLSNTHLTEDIFESFFGALSLEQSYENCRDLFIKIVETEIDIAELIYNDDNYKDRLMRYCHKIKWPEPKYFEDTNTSNGGRDKDTNDPNIPRNFTMYTKNPSGKIIGIGEGSSIKKAEQEAAKSALVALGVIKENDSEDQGDDYYGEASDNEYFDEENVDNGDYFVASDSE